MERELCQPSGSHRSSPSRPWRWTSTLYAALLVFVSTCQQPVEWNQNPFWSPTACLLHRASLLGHYSSLKIKCILNTSSRLCETLEYVWQLQSEELLLREVHHHLQWKGTRTWGLREPGTCASLRCWSPRKPHIGIGYGCFLKQLSLLLCSLFNTSLLRGTLPLSFSPWAYWF